ncbi:hydrogenase expression/formation protein HypE [Alteromonadaceae bacterium 2753L.S.0a.02]|nr:hydrogenase expression/formation protein HypE [Alteromonadaceae bacterium 2753L.S.0a.02]
MSQALKRFNTTLDIVDGVVDLSHGSGGRASAQLIAQCFTQHFENPMLSAGNDFATFTTTAGRMVMATDCHVISPLFFPGGDIGSLAVHGTINDVCMSGATPWYLAAGFILEEGFPLRDLDQIAASMARAARKAGVTIVTGDTKVVEKGKGDGAFITTTGVGLIPPGIHISGELAQPGDVVIVSGSIGDHGVAIMSQRENLQFETPIVSDSAALHEMVASLLHSRASIHCLRDPTRGGLATTLNELAQQSQVGIKIHESQIPVKPGVAAACELLGLDPLYVANEGKLVCICAASDAKKVLDVIRAHPLGQEAEIIGSVVEDAHYFVHMETQFGGQRIVDWLAGEQLPRIC